MGGAGSYMIPVLQAVQADVPRGVHTGTGRVDHHGNGGADVTARSGHRVRLMKPDAHWDIILTSCKHITLPAENETNTRTSLDRTEPDQARLNQARPDRTRPGQTEPDQTEPDRTEPDQARSD